jgi:hypothetical protein
MTVRQQNLLLEALGQLALYEEAVRKLVCSESPREIIANIKSLEDLGSDNPCLYRSQIYKHLKRLQMSDQLSKS